MKTADSRTPPERDAVELEAAFCGVGEAFDENYSNTSVLVRFFHKGENKSILLDCGFTAAPAFWKTSRRPMELDGAWISHLHGDHYLGLPQLLIRFSEHGREKALQICGARGTREAVCAAMELAYPGKLDKLPFKLFFVEAILLKPFEIAGIKALAVDIEHSVPCLGIRFDFEGKSLFYTGDGRVPGQTLEAVRGCDLGIFETFTLDSTKKGHSSVTEAVDAARSAGIKYMAAVHMGRDERRLNAHLVQDRMAESGVSGFLPEPGDLLKI